MISELCLRRLGEAVQTRDHISGYTHNFYKYPARFSPIFARAAIEAFSKPGDLVLDPFMGGGTTLVEARTCGRIGLGFDVNELAVFIARVKTTLLSSSDVRGIELWEADIATKVRLSLQSLSEPNELNGLYLRHMNSFDTWRLRRLIENGLDSLHYVIGEKQRGFLRCAFLSTGQWALDCRLHVPSTNEFRIQLRSRIDRMLQGAIEYSRAARRADRVSKGNCLRRTVCQRGSAVDIESKSVFQHYDSPRLVLTSPPYPGVHVLYHRWQIQSRRETALPYWIANCQDGTGSSYYTFGDRKQPGLERYFDVAGRSFRSIRAVCDKKTTLVQLVGFSEPSWQLPAYLDMMHSSGFELAARPLETICGESLVFRKVPNRKWYAANKGDTPSSNEVLLIHRPSY